ncbi:MAG: hypothetical protein CMP20_10350 [Rickettsiales bacterium]|nr:hypothetical protein [Rickettsiales bacterium]
MRILVRHVKQVECKGLVSLALRTTKHATGNLLCGPTKYYSKAECDPERYDDTSGSILKVVISKHKSLKQPVFEVEAHLGNRNEQGELKRTICGSGTFEKGLDLLMVHQKVREALLEAECPTYLAHSIVDTAVIGSSDFCVSSPFTSPIMSEED